MKKRLISMLLTAAMTASVVTVPVSVGAASYTKQVEYLDRGLIAVKTTGGVYLSWRLLGTESTSQQFDIYRDGVLYKTVDATNYLDDEGFVFYRYKVVPKGGDPMETKEVSVMSKNYIDIPINRPASATIDKTGEFYTYSANDATVADVDGDGEYEYILKWDPSNSKDNSQRGYTGTVYIDCYEMDGEMLWRINLGKNIRAGAHYTQFIAYDFDGDGKAEVAMKTAPGSIDGTGKYVTEAGNTSTIRNQSNSVDYRYTGSGSRNGQIISGVEYLTMFNGETGEAMQTIDYEPSRGSASDWGSDSYGGRSERYLACVAYLNGSTPSLVMCRGYYQRAAVTTYNWVNGEFVKIWARDDKSSGSSTIYGQGAHSISVADADNDGKDEIIFGSAVIDDDGDVISNTRLGHGDALHVSDFNNDGNQEVFMVHEDKSAYTTAGAEVHSAATGSFYGKVPASSDTGRGVMGNVDSNPDRTTDEAVMWSSASGSLFAMDGTELDAYAPGSYNFLTYWDGDLTRELLDKNRIEKYDSSVGTTRLETFDDVHANNSSKATPSLSADIFGDWREEVIYGTTDDQALRIFFTTTYTDYKIPTLMHDTQYRCAIAWQNVGYNQPPHTSYFIGDEVASGNTIDPAVSFDDVEFAHTPDIDYETIISDEEMTFLDGSDSFNSGVWGFSATKASVTEIEAPYKNVLYLSGGTVTSSISDLPAQQAGTVTGISVNNFMLSNENKKATAQIKNLNADAINPVVAFAAYNADGSLASVSLSEATINSRKNGIISADMTEIPEGGYVRAFALESMATQKPICSPISTDVTSTSKVIEDDGVDLTMKLSFMWKPAGSTCSLYVNDTTASATSSAQTLVRLYKTSSGALSYYIGTSKTVISDDMVNNAWYKVEMTLDFSSQSFDLNILDYENPDVEEVTLYGIPFNAAATYSTVNAIKATGACYIDNILFNRIEYNVDKAVASFEVTEGGSPVKNAVITIDNKELKTNASGQAQVKLTSGKNYSYTVEKEAYKTSRGTLALNADTISPVELAEGEERNVYVQYMNQNGLQISDTTLVGTGTENTTFTVTDAMKGDITYTFTEDEDMGDDASGHKAGDIVVYEYDANNSKAAAVNIEEDNDTLVRLTYKERRVPVAGLDTLVSRINFSADGIGKNYWSTTVSGGYYYAEDDIKYMVAENIGTNAVKVNLPKSITSGVMEFDMMYMDADYGGNVFSFVPMYDTVEGTSIGLRTSSSTNQQWQWVYNNSNYISYSVGESGDKAYTYASNWKNVWAHVVLVFDGEGNCNVSVINKSTGDVYFSDYPVEMANSVGTSSVPVTGITFMRSTGTGAAIIGLSEFKAYTIGTTSEDVEPTTETREITIPGTATFTLNTATHVSDYEGFDYNIGGLIGVTYELQDMNGNAVSPSGFSLSDNGVLTVTTNDTSKQYRVAVKLGDNIAQIYNLTYQVKTNLFTSSFSGSTDGFVGYGGSNYSMSGSSGTLKYSQNLDTSRGEFYKDFGDITSGVVDVEFTFKTGGNKIDGSNWNWTGYEYEFAIQFLDKDYNAASNVGKDNADDNLLMEISQAYTTSAQSTKYKLNGGSSTNVSGAWTMVGTGGSVLNRSVTVWIVKAKLDLDNNTGDFEILNEDNTNGYKITGVSLGSSNGFGVIRFLSRKNGDAITWTPLLYNMTVNVTE